MIYVFWKVNIIVYGLNGYWEINFALFIWNFPQDFFADSLPRLGRLAVTEAVLHSCDIIQSSVHVKSSSISQLIIGKQEIFKKYSKF